VQLHETNLKELGEDQEIGWAM